MGKLVVVVGGFYGSEAKGAVVAHLTRTEPEPPVVVRVGGPNAGHTVYDDNGVRWPLRQIPAGVVRSESPLVIGAGSVVDQEVLTSEIEKLEAGGHKVRDRLFIDGMATVLTQADREHEERNGIVDRIGSTGKGIGIARAGRIMRTGQIVVETSAVNGIRSLSKDYYFSGGTYLHDQLALGQTVIVEGTQGYALGLHRWFYPYATSQDCTAIDVLAQAQISPWDKAVTKLEIWVVFRTYPIRVAGHSGPMHEEISWDRLEERTGGYIQPEKTTVTQKVRRVGEWDNELAKDALAANGGNANPHVHAALMMADYLDPALAGSTATSLALDAAVEPIERELKHGFALLGTGPKTIVDRRR